MVRTRADYRLSGLGDQAWPLVRDWLRRHDSIHRDDTSRNGEMVTVFVKGGDGVVMRFTRELQEHLRGMASGRIRACLENSEPADA